MGKEETEAQKDQDLNNKKNETKTMNKEKINKKKSLKDNKDRKKEGEVREEIEEKKEDEEEEEEEEESVGRGVLDMSFLLRGGRMVDEVVTVLACGNSCSEWRGVQASVAPSVTSSGSNFFD